MLEYGIAIAVSQRLKSCMMRVRRSRRSRRKRRTITQGMQSHEPLKMPMRSYGMHVTKSMQNQLFTYRSAIFQ